MRPTQAAIRDAQRAQGDLEASFKQRKTDQITYDVGILKQYRRERRSEQIEAAQHSILDDSVDSDFDLCDMQLQPLRDVIGLIA